MHNIDIFSAYKTMCQAYFKARSLRAELSNIGFYLRNRNSLRKYVNGHRAGYMEVLQLKRDMDKELDVWEERLEIAEIQVLMWVFFYFVIFNTVATCVDACVVDCVRFC